MRKFISSLTFILVFAAYALNQNHPVQSPIGAATATTSTVAKPVAAKTVARTAPTALPPQKPLPAQKPAVLAQGAYRDGTYTGVAADAYYGNVQVQITIASGKIADVTFLDYPKGRGTSQSINSYAIPQLTQEAIQAQSAKVNGVSGASATSAAFKQSLASALAQAKA